MNTKSTYKYTIIVSILIILLIREDMIVVYCDTYILHSDPELLFLKTIELVIKIEMAD